MKSRLSIGASTILWPIVSRSDPSVTAILMRSAVRLSHPRLHVRQMSHRTRYARRIAIAARGSPSAAAVQPRKVRSFARLSLTTVDQDTRATADL